MREIKVRGYAIEEMIGSQWMYGTGIFVRTFTDEFAKLAGKKHEYFIFMDSGWMEVHGESIGQYTGLTDKNGKEIYEGDFVIVDNTWGDVVRYHQGCFMVDDDVLGAIHSFSEVQRNIYENPKLLEYE
ncbi:phage uncharacterized protein TIGR01671 [Gracilibacillus orientalis]|uniref:Phage uncharacterized protein TIGR01671 n=1 Tax=Gracilibacillus orientalis TaxID=334253 RepID=A0A1I4HBM9_9BACI|nr:YopX family protein [Gracilibacillus orientalis]SFL39565.1 phage uncharacterized protein TIGR01671 [Gracilibacillus orientalis]